VSQRILSCLLLCGTLLDFYMNIPDRVSGVLARNQTHQRQNISRLSGASFPLWCGISSTRGVPRKHKRRSVCNAGKVRSIVTSSIGTLSGNATKKMKPKGKLKEGKKKIRCDTTTPAIHAWSPIHDRSVILNGKTTKKTGHRQKFEHVVNLRMLRVRLHSPVRGNGSFWLEAEVEAAAEEVAWPFNAEGDPER
jgi:hypothetical protein